METGWTRTDWGENERQLGRGDGWRAFEPGRVPSFQDQLDTQWARSFFLPGGFRAPSSLGWLGGAPRLPGLFFESWGTPGGMHLPQACHWSEKAAVAQTGLPENLANFGEILMPRAIASAG